MITKSSIGSLLMGIFLATLFTSGIIGVIVVTFIMFGVPIPGTSQVPQRYAQRTALVLNETVMVEAEYRTVETSKNPAPKDISKITNLNDLLDELVASNAMRSTDADSIKAENESAPTAYKLFVGPVFVGSDKVAFPVVTYPEVNDSAKGYPNVAQVTLDDLGVRVTP